MWKSCGVIIIIIKVRVSDKSRRIEEQRGHFSNDPGSVVVVINFDTDKSHSLT